jgi:NAD+ synthase (glutamine-hydrolysing)
MTGSLEKIVLAQLNYTVGDIEGNCQKILKVYQGICNENSLLICSELALTGYYPQDLVSKESVLRRQDEALKKLAQATVGKSAGIVVGYIARNTQATGKRLFNALAFLANGEQIFEYHKRLLPTYNIFDEARHFSSGDSSELKTKKSKGFSNGKGSE